MDASAILAMFNGERGEEIVRAALPGSVISTVNVAEVGARVADAGFGAAELQVYFAGTELEIVSFDTGLAFDSAELREPTRAFGLSLGDRACLALARQRGLPVLTADGAWARLRVGGVKVELIRSRAT